jgi:hypothetical protein
MRTAERKGGSETKRTAGACPAGTTGRGGAAPYAATGTRTNSSTGSG